MCAAAGAAATDTGVLEDLPIGLPRRGQRGQRRPRGKRSGTVEKVSAIHAEVHLELARVIGDDRACGHASGAEVCVRLSLQFGECVRELR